MKKVAYSVMSTEKCADCTSFIKANVANRVSRRPLRCYRCHKALRKVGTWHSKR